MKKMLTIITDAGRRIPDIFLKDDLHIVHIGITADDGPICVDVTIYKGLTIDRRTVRNFRASMPMLAQAYIYSCLRGYDAQNTVIYQYSAQTLYIAQELIFRSQLPYAIWAQAEQGYTWRDYHFLSSARARFCFEIEEKQAWDSAYVFDCDHVEGKIELHDILTKVASPVSWQMPAASHTKNVLLISYYAPPSQTVAVNRLKYWHEKLPEIASENGVDMSTMFMTANASYKTDDSYIVVPDHGSFNCPAGTAQGNLADKMAQFGINNVSVYWSYHVQRYLEQRPDFKVDAVVMSGNPFYYFDLGEYFRKKHTAKVILDFRDPFANNPRFTYSAEHKQLVCDLEDDYMQHADYALSVNKYCLDALRLRAPEQGQVVANGYDEQIVDQVKKIPLRVEDHKTNFIYTGSFYADRKADTFLAELDVQAHRLIHVGRSGNADRHLDRYAALSRYGLAPYRDVVAYCMSASAGIIFTSGASFEQTTKIFDYIAANIDIVIVTDGEIETGELHELTKDMTGIYWVQNTASDVRRFLKTYKPFQRRRPQRTEYSRWKQTERLYQLIHS